jgi:hypothetical protein
MRLMATCPGDGRVDVFMNLVKEPGITPPVVQSVPKTLFLVRL